MDADKLAFAKARRLKPVAWEARLIEFNTDADVHRDKLSEMENKVRAERTCGSLVKRTCI